MKENDRKGDKKRQFSKSQVSPWLAQTDYDQIESV